jgi:ribonuclease BN (tRNA processing enzyme)
MELVILGAGPAYTDRKGATGAAYLLRNGEATLLLDLGQGSFPALARELEPSRLLGIVVSHLHADHFIDLIALRHYLRYELDPPRRVTVHAASGLADRIDALHASPGFTAEVLDVVDLEAGVMEIGPFRVESRRVTHTSDSYGFRVDTGGEGPGIVYSGDCGRAADLAPLIRPGDTLLTEASFGPGPMPFEGVHLDAISIRDLVADTKPGRVLLTHIQMGYDREQTAALVRDGFDGGVELVDPGQRFDLRT